MFHRASLDRLRWCLGFTMVCSAISLTGCQSPDAAGGLRLPGTPRLPGFPSSPTPSFSSGGKTPAVPGMHSTAQTPSIPESTAPGVSPMNDSQAIAQVGFVDRIRHRVSDGGAACQSCVPGAACQPCPPTAYGMPGRPVDPQEFLCNGGDQPTRAVVMRDDTVGGLQPQDAIVHYTTEAGDIEVQPSNRVCVYSPRFGSIRQVSGAVAGEKAVGLKGTFQPVGPTGIGLSLPSLSVQEVDELAHADVAKRVDAMRDRNRGVPVEAAVQPYLAADALQILATLDSISLKGLDESQILLLQQGAQAAQSWMIRDAVEVMIKSMQPPVLTRDARVEGFVEYDFPDAGRLQIVKVADKNHAGQGEEVTFAIKIRNVGDSPVHRVEIVDSLVTRLEYIEGSQTCDRGAEFDTAGNSAGSLRMKWTLTEPLDVGESAEIEFKCRVR